MCHTRIASFVAGIVPRPIVLRIVVSLQQLQSAEAPRPAGCCRTASIHMACKR